jgi:hypothetical protein
MPGEEKMNTPAHVAVNLLLLTRKDRPGLVWPAAAGSLAPDVPILIFYGWARMWAQLSESEIWTSAYFHPGWQAAFDLAHSLPVALLGAVGFAAAGRAGAAVFFAGLGLHALGDLLLHHDDAHRHLFPLSDWRFESPVSYWDPAHHGTVFSVLEVFAVALSAWLLARRFPQSRRWIGAMVAVYGIYWAYVAVVWM